MNKLPDGRLHGVQVVDEAVAVRVAREDDEVELVVRDLSEDLSAGLAHRPIAAGQELHEELVVAAAAQRRNVERRLQGLLLFLGQRDGPGRTQVERHVVQLLGGGHQRAVKIFPRRRHVQRGGRPMPRLVAAFQDLQIVRLSHELADLVVRLLLFPLTTLFLEPLSVFLQLFAGSLLLCRDRILHAAAAAGQGHNAGDQCQDGQGPYVEKEACHKSFSWNDK